MNGRKALFWVSATMVGYTYAGFPALVALRARLRPAPHRSADITPFVSLVIAAYNERGAIGSKIENSLALDYPRDQLEIIVASDGSTDGTNEIVSEYADRGVRLLALERGGKAAALNRAVAEASGDILVFSDANSQYDPDAIRALVRPFADPAVGGVAGDQRYGVSPAADGTAEGERAYWDFERRLKRAESLAGNTISATGAIYAIRRELFSGVPVGVTDDFAVSTSVIVQGRRLVFAGDAIAREPVAVSSGREWDRKVRVITRGLRGVYERRALLDPRLHGFYAIQLLSQKVLRRLMGLPLIAILVVTPSLWRAGWMYRVAAAGQALVYGLGLGGLLLGRRGLGRRRPLAAPAYFLLVNAAALRAAWNVVTGRRIDRWEPARDAEPHRLDEA